MSKVGLSSNVVQLSYIFPSSLLKFHPADEKESATRDNCVFNGPLGCTTYSAHSFRSLAALTHSAALRFSKLASLARSIHGLAHSLRSLPRGMVEIHEYVFTL